MLSTMCGHGMISHSLAKKMIDFVKRTAARRSRRRPPDAFLLVRCVQSGPREENSRRCPHTRRRSSALAGALLAAAGLSVQCSEPPPPAPPAAIAAYRNFTVFDGTDREPMTNAAMLVDNGRDHVDRSGRIMAAPAGVVPADLAGGFVIPGLIDLHAHLGNTVDLTQDKANYTRESVERDLETYAAYGVTTVQSMGTDQDADLRRAQRTAGRTSDAGPGVHRRAGPGVQGRLWRSRRRQPARGDRRRGRAGRERPGRQEAWTSSSSGSTTSWGRCRRCRRR